MKQLCMALSLAGVMAVPNVFASMSVVLMDNTSQYSAGDGGEFRAVGGGNPTLDGIVNWSAYSASTQGTVSAATDGSSWGYNSSLIGEKYFQTFCIQTTVYFTPGNTYNASPGDSITLGTAWLYSQFAAGTLSGYGYDYTYGSGRTASAGALQQAIWYLQGQVVSLVGTYDGTAYYNAAVAAVGAANVKTDGNGAYGVESLNLSDASGLAAQDQLVIAVPETTTVIAGMLLLLPLGASTLRILRKTRMA